METKHIEKALNNIERIKYQQGITGISSGFKMVDEHTDGWQSDDLIVMVEPYEEYPLTALGIAFALNAAHQQKSVAYFSFEKSPDMLVQHMIRTEFYGESSLINGISDEDFQKVTANKEKLEELPIFIDSTPKMSIFDLRKKARYFKQQNNIDLIVIDNYNRLTITGDRNKKQKGERGLVLSTLLKELAQELKIPIIVLMSMELIHNECTEIVPGICPKLSELDAWNGLELNADIVAFLQVYEFYGVDARDWNKQKGYTLLRFYKIRNSFYSKGINTEIHHKNGLTFQDEIYKGMK